MIVKVWDKKEFINGHSPEVIFNEYPWSKYADTVITQVGNTTLYVDNIDIIKDSLGVDESISIEEVLQMHKEVLMEARVPEPTVKERFTEIELENIKLNEMISSLEDENAELLFNSIENDIRMGMLESDVADLLINIA